ncbi:ribbon-helix-helix protein, CopG family [Oricola sp.]|uniref:CopG family ribbon-helix-helix protein n=1 Tax=Oricola sp. TaxID=1979950 RepID=UPI0025D42046|nr:ribbon-helix-helix protein, CopG family [Oricola sp.]MCI5077177.1 ribbon-helix-helix protein, CopG family [Oricola sp.]
MNVKPDISPELSARIDELARRFGVDRAEIVREALEDGHSLIWQAEWRRRIEEGLDAANAGDFADAAEVDAVIAKYR